MSQFADDHTLLRIKRTQLQLVQAQGYRIPDDEALFLTNPLESDDDPFRAALEAQVPDLVLDYQVREQRYSALLQAFRARYTRSAEERERPPSSLTNIYVHTTERVRDDPLRLHVFYPPLPRKVRMTEESFAGLGIFNEGGFIPPYQRLIVISPLPLIESLRQRILTIESVRTRIFIYDEMLLNPFQHVLAEPMSLYNEALPAGVQPRSMPRLLETGIAARFMGWAGGQVVAVGRTPVHKGTFVTPESLRVVK